MSVLHPELDNDFNETLEAEIRYIVSSMQPPTALFTALEKSLTFWMNNKGRTIVDLQIDFSTLSVKGYSVPGLVDNWGTDNLKEALYELYSVFYQMHLLLAKIHIRYKHTTAIEFMPRSDKLASWDLVSSISPITEDKIEDNQ